MLESVPLRAGDVVVEYGPGTGSFTSVLLERMPGGVEYLGIERDPEFHRNLVRRFSGVRFHHGSAEDTPAILDHHRLGRAKLVLSGLPFANMPSDLQGRILGATRTALHAEGVFRAFTYLFSSISPRTARFKQLAREHFHDHSSGRTVMKNFPPAKVLSYSRPARPELIPDCQGMAASHGFEP